MENIRFFIKSAFSLTSTLIISPILVLYFVLNSLFKSDSLFAGFSQLLSLIPGKTGNYCRAGFYRFTLTVFEKDAVASFLVLFAQRDTEIGSGVYIGPNSNIGSSKIGKNSLLGSAVHIMSGKKQHNWHDPSSNIKDQGGEFEKISIGEDCWIGNGALIMANVGDKCIIGSGSVVINDIPDFAVVAGNPAKVIRVRKK